MFQSIEIEVKHLHVPRKRPENKERTLLYSINEELSRGYFQIVFKICQISVLGYQTICCHKKIPIDTVWNY